MVKRVFSPEHLTGTQLLFLNPLATRVHMLIKPKAKNPNLDVEVSSETEVGTDLTVNICKGNWLKAVNLSSTYWKRNTDNAIYYHKCASFNRRDHFPYQCDRIIISWLAGRGEHPCLSSRNS